MHRLRTIYQHFIQHKFYFIGALCTALTSIAIEWVGSISRILCSSMDTSIMVMELIKDLAYISLSIGTTFALIYLICGRRLRHLPLVLLIILSLFAWANLLHIRAFSCIIAPSSYLQWQNLNGLAGSIGALTRPSDLLYLLIPLIYGILYFRLQHRIVIPRYPIRWLTIILLAITAFPSFGVLSKLLLIGGPTYQIERSILTPELFYCRFGTINTCLFALHTHHSRTQHQHTSECRTNVEAQLQTISHPPLISQLMGTGPTKKNLIIVLVESLNSKALTLDINGEALMPYLRQCLQDSQTLATLKVIHPQQAGVSIAGQLNILTGLIAPSEGVFSFEYLHHHYPSIIKTLRKAYPSLQSSTCVPTESGYWGQNNVNRSLGVDSLLGKYEINPSFGEISSWLSDQTVFEFALRRAQTQSKDPLFMLVLNSETHAPYDQVDASHLTFPKDIPLALQAYYTKIHRLDRQLRMFIEGLKNIDNGQFHEETLILITSDHNMIMPTLPGVDIHEDPIRMNAVSRYTPMLFLNTGYPMHQHSAEISEDTFVQVQAYPTLLSLLNLKDTVYHGLLPSLLDPQASKEWVIEPIDRQHCHPRMKSAYQISNAIVWGCLPL